MTIVRFSVPRIPATLNVILRKHWSVRDGEQQRWAQEVAVAALAAKLRKQRPVFAGPVGVELHYEMKSKRAKNDLDNRVPKMLIDAMKGWVYQDDSQIVDLRQTITRGCPADRTHILVRPASTECEG